jgi:diguanylate cyclase (GGDEF)-like protein/PAS domain S-box-containing protein
VHPDDREEAARWCARAATEGGDHGLSYRAVAADGRAVWLRDMLHVSSDEQGAPVKLRGVMFDITGEREIEALKSAILDGALECIVTISADGSVREWNRAAEAVFGFTRVGAVGRDLAELILPEGARAAHRDELARHLAGSSVSPLVGAPREITARHEDGHEIAAELAITEVPSGANGSDRLFTVYLRDITDRVDARRRQAAIRELEAQALGADDLQQLLEAVVACARSVLGMDRGAILGLREQEVVVTAVEGSDSEKVGASAPLAERPLESAALASSTATVVEDWATEPRFELPSGLARLGVGSSICCPVSGRQRTWGFLLLHADRPRRFLAEEMDFVEALSYILAGSYEREGVEEGIRREALRDELTGLPNRALFEDQLEQTLNSSPGEGTVAVLLLGLDGIEQFNHALGYEAGNEVLRAVARRITDALPDGVEVARFAGDAFVVLCSSPSAGRDAHELAHRLSAAIAGSLTVSGQQLAVSASVGIALNGAAWSHADLLRDAASALHLARGRGRDRIESFDPRLRTQLVDELRLENELRSAIDGGQLRLLYQPIVSLDGRSSDGVEALVRWEHPRLGMLPPARFVPLAERSGLIVPLGAWALRAACLEQARWIARHAGRQPPRISINVAAVQLASPQFMADVTEALGQAGVSGDRLAVEVTETGLMEASLGATVLQELRFLGIQIFLDDFGTGYSSLSYLQRVPLDGVKIDRSFVHELEATEEARAIVDAIVAMGRALGLTVIAEGIETERQLAALRSLGCGYGQGHLFSPALPADAAFAALASGPLS